MSKMPALSKRYTQKEIHAAIEKARGLTYRVLRELDISYAQYLGWLETHPDEKEYAKKLRQDVVDKAEDMIMRMLDEDVAPNIRLDAAKFILRNHELAKEWKEATPKQEITVKDGEVNIKQIFGINDNDN